MVCALAAWLPVPLGGWGCGRFFSLWRRAPGASPNRAESGWVGGSPRQPQWWRRSELGGRDRSNQRKENRSAQPQGRLGAKVKVEFFWRVAPSGIRPSAMIAALASRPPLSDDAESSAQSTPFLRTFVKHPVIATVAWIFGGDGGGPHVDFEPNSESEDEHDRSDDQLPIAVPRSPSQCDADGVLAQVSSRGDNLEEAFQSELAKEHDRMRAPEDRPRAISASNTSSGSRKLRSLSWRDESGGSLVQVLGTLDASTTRPVVGGSEGGATSPEWGYYVDTSPALAVYAATNSAREKVLSEQRRIAQGEAMTAMTAS